ncbi:MAG TPA: tetratricopeptide repeat protein, partial [Thermoanaerobaculia bacterium]|nr:tetratricopeptide repeat protein [Thermoanaerobaculia bacterium]
MQNPKYLVLAALTALATTACAGTALRPDTAVADDELRELKARVVELQRKAAVSEVEIARLREEVAALSAARGGARSALPASAAPSMPMPSLSSTSSTSARRSSPAPAPASRTPPRASAPPAPAPAAPRAEERGGDVVSQRRETAVPIEEVDVPEPDRPTPSTPPPAAARPPAKRAPTSAPLPPGQVVEGPGESAETLPPAAQALYDRGYTLYHQGHFVDAVASFQRFLQSEPKSELADNALYWIGECRYSRHDLRGA